MKPVRVFINIIYFILAALFACSILILMERIFGASYAFMRTAAAGAPVMLCYIAGYISDRRKTVMRVVLLVVSDLIACGAALLLLPSLSQFLFAISCLVPGTMLFFVGMRAYGMYPTSFAVGTVALYLTEIVVFVSASLGDNYLDLIGKLAFVTFVLSLYTFNGRGLRSGAHKTGRRDFSIPSGLRFGNVTLITVFILVTFLIGFCAPLREAILSVLGFVWHGALTVVKAIGSLMDSKPPETPTMTPIPTQNFMLPADYEKNDTWTGTVLVITAIIIGFIGVYYLIRNLRRNRFSGLRKWFSSLAARIRRLFETPEEAAYTDDVETLVSLRDMLKKSADSVKELWKKATSRPQTIDDMPNNAMRVRFAYKALLKSELGERKAAVYKTPAEVQACVEEAELRQLAGDYSQVRYAPDPEAGRAATDAAAENAKSALHRLKERRRTKKTRQKFD